MNSISKFTLKPSNGSNCAHLSPSSARTRFFTRMKRFGARCSSMPADCSRNTNGPALPSMIGTSAAESSTIALSIPSPAKADSGQVCKLAQARLAQLRADPNREEVARFARELSCEELRPQVTRLLESLGVSLSVGQELPRPATPKGA